MAKELKETTRNIVEPSPSKGDEQIDAPSYRWLADNYLKHNKVKEYISANLDTEGKLKNEGLLNTEHRPSAIELEDFVRFFKEVKNEIDCGHITWEVAKEKFSYYALKFYTYDFFHNSLRDGLGSPIWKDFRDYCEHILEMK